MDYPDCISPAEATMSKHETKRRTDDEIFGDDSLGKVRGILFGDLTRETNERLDHLERALTAGMGDLRSDMDRHIESLTKMLENETGKRKDLRREVEKAMDGLSNSLNSSSSASRQLLDLTRSELDRKIDLVHTDLSDAKVDRSALAALFATTATQLHADSETTEDETTEDAEG